MMKRHLLLASIILLGSGLSRAAMTPDGGAVPPASSPNEVVASYERAPLQNWDGERLDGLRLRLKLRPGQTLAWQSYYSAMLRGGTDRTQSFPHYLAAWADGSEAILLSRIRAQEEDAAQTLAVTERFYRQLTREQKRIFDAEALAG